MGRHKQPLELALLKGAARNHPGRYRAQVPKSDYALGDAPGYMSEAAKSAWSELAAYSLPGVLAGSDRFVVEIASTLLAEFRRDPVEFQVGKYSHLVGILARLGLSPSDRQRFEITEPEEPNPFDRF